LSIKISPEDVSYSLAIRSRIVDFPEPVFPIIATVSPSFMVNDISLSAVMLVSSKVNVTFLNSMVPFIGVSSKTSLLISGCSFKNSFILF